MKKKLKRYSAMEKMKLKLKPVWIVIDDLGLPRDFSDTPEILGVHQIPGWRTIRYVPAPTTKKRKAKRK